MLKKNECLLALCGMEALERDIRRYVPPKLFERAISPVLQKKGVRLEFVDVNTTRLELAVVSEAELLPAGARIAVFGLAPSIPRRNKIADCAKQFEASLWRITHHNVLGLRARRPRTDKEIDVNFYGMNYESIRGLDADIILYAIAREETTTNKYSDDIPRWRSHTSNKKLEFLWKRDDNFMDDNMAALVTSVSRPSPLP